MSDLDKAAKVKELFLADQTQNVLASAVVDTCIIAIKLAGHWAVLDPSIAERSLSHFETFRQSDISSFASLFRKKIRYLHSDTGYETDGRLVNMLRSVQDTVMSKVGRGREFGQVRDFSFKVRELVSLTEFLREARNIFSHDMRTRSDLGWNVAVLGNLLRVLEVALINENMQQVAAVTSDKAQVLLAQYFEQDFRGVRDGSGMDSNSKLVLIDRLDRVEEELLSLKDYLPSLFSEFRNSISGMLHGSEIAKTSSDTVVLAHTTDSDSSEFSDEHEVQDELIDQQFESFLTPEGARRELLNLGKQFDQINYGEGNYWPGITGNVLQEPIIFDLLRNKCRSINDARNLSAVKWRYERYPDLMDKQIALFGKQIDAVLEQIGYPSDLEVL